MANGKLISFIGMDGSGKSTLSKITKETLVRKGHKAVLIYTGRGRNNLLPIQFFGNLYRKAGGRESNLPEEKRGQSNFEKISIIHTLAAPVFAFDLILRYFFVINPASRKNDFVITDRYSTDILLMNKVPFGFKKFLYFFIPKPDKVIYVYNKISVLHKRKSDHPIKDLERQEKLYSKILKGTNAVKIKNDSIQKSMKQIMEELL